MFIEINMETQLRDIDLFFQSIQNKAVKKATKRALNRAASSLRVFAVKKMQEERKFPVSKIKQRIVVNKVRGNSLARMNSEVVFLGSPLPLIYFVKGKKQPRRVTKRSRPLRFEISKGNTSAKKGLFIASAKRGEERYQVFRRVDKKDRSKGMKKQSAPSIAHIFMKKRNMRQAIESRGSLLLQKEFTRELKFQLDKLR